jgi:hypothetical protein
MWHVTVFSRSPLLYCTIRVSHRVAEMTFDGTILREVYFVEDNAGLHLPLAEMSSSQIESNRDPGTTIIYR